MTNFVRIIDTMLRAYSVPSVPLHPRCIMSLILTLTRALMQHEYDVQY